MKEMLPLAALAVAYAGFVTLGLAMDRHQMQMLGRELPRWQTLSLRMTGSMLLGGSLLVCLATWSTSIAILWWLGLLSIAGLALGLMLAYRPRWARPIGLAFIVAAAVGWLAGFMGANGVAGG